MIHTQYDETALYDIKVMVNSEVDKDINYFGLPKEKFIYEGRVYEPFQLQELSFFGQEFLDDDNSYETIPFTEISKYKPQHIAQEYYGNPRLAYLILYANKISAVTDFTPEKLNGEIKIIKFSILLEISNLIDLKNQDGISTVTITDCPIFEF